MSTLIQQHLVEVSEKIETLVKQNQIDYIDACILYCEQNNLEVEYVGEIIQKNHQLRAKIQQEAEDLHYLKKSARLRMDRL